MQSSNSCVDINRISFNVFWFERRLLSRNTLSIKSKIISTSLRLQVWVSSVTERSFNQSIFKHLGPSKSNAPKFLRQVSAERDEKHCAESHFELSSDSPVVELICTATAEVAVLVPSGERISEIWTSHSMIYIKVGTLAYQASACSIISSFAKKRIEACLK